MDSKSSGGVGIFTLLTLLLVGLKLTDYIDWSWWWVLTPLWLPLCVVGVLAVIWLFLATRWMSN